MPITVTLHRPLNAFTPDFVISDFAISYTEINDHTHWQSVSDQHIISFRSFLKFNLPILPDDVISCTDPSCSSHCSPISIFIDSLLLCL